MADRYSGTILPQSPDTLENQKAILDLLRKINEVASMVQSSSAGATSVSVAASSYKVPTGIYYLVLQGIATSNMTLNMGKPVTGLLTYYITIEAYTTNNSSIILSAGGGVNQTIRLPATAGHIFLTAYVDSNGYVYLPASRYV